METPFTAVEKGKTKLQKQTFSINLDQNISCKYTRHALTKILIEENRPIDKPIETISNWLISMYLRMVLVQELAQASPGQKTIFLNAKFRHFRVLFWLF